MSRKARTAATLFALLAGGLHIGALWFEPLATPTLLGAGRGVVFILLFLGLMGTSRLSLVATSLFCCTALIDALSLQFDLATGVELCLLASVLIALLRNDITIREG
ncbi:hypothetical protein [Luminiphilus syltensis]|nr:hypothetical protein [Luminiphilus syltensis]